MLFRSDTQQAAMKSDVEMKHAMIAQLQTMSDQIQQLNDRIVALSAQLEAAPPRRASPSRPSPRSEAPHQAGLLNKRSSRNAHNSDWRSRVPPIILGTPFIAASSRWVGSAQRRPPYRPSKSFSSLSIWFARVTHGLYR